MVSCVDIIWPEIQKNDETIFEQTKLSDYKDPFVISSL